ncbi:MAG: hypothetical protein WBN04_08050, partial [Paracoccaceae bacterium]
MTRHIADKDHARGSARIRQYARIEHETVPNPVTKALQTRPEERDEAARLKAYVKIERGSRA